MQFPGRRWAAPVCVLVLAVPFVGGSDAAYHVAERVTDAFMSAAADFTAFEGKASNVKDSPEQPRIRVAQSGEDWIEALRTGSYWKNSRETGRRGRSARREKPSREERKAARSPSDTPTADRPSSSSGTRTVTKVVIAAHTGSLSRRGNGEIYRTVCVRLCDGYYWPISFAADSADLARDSAKCEQSCSMPAKLYYAPMLSEAPELVDLNGQPYTKLGTAFQFRTTYSPNCKCRAHPWEKEAEERHRAYAASEATSAAEPEQTAADAIQAKSPQ
jgi:hypothetical protein